MLRNRIAATVPEMQPKLAMQGINERYVAAVRALAQAQSNEKALQDQAKIRQEAFSQLQQKHNQVVQAAMANQHRLDNANREVVELRQNIEDNSEKLIEAERELDSLRQANEGLQHSLSTCMLELDDSQTEARDIRARYELTSQSTGKLEESISRLQLELQVKVGVAVRDACCMLMLLSCYRITSS